ncbi:endopeptidase La [Patescibacteria group bacterium]|nr:MAG: endopeptidase La [Patescibacteria group bacterium]
MPEPRDLPIAAAPPPAVIPPHVPVVALADLVMFPKISVPLLLTDPQAQEAVTTAQAAGQIVAFITVKKARPDKKAQPDDMYDVGTACRVREAMKLPDDTMRLLVEGLERVRVSQVVAVGGHLEADVAAWPAPQSAKNDRVEAEMYSVVNQFKEAVSLGAPVPFDVMLVVMNLTDPWQLADLIALNMDFRADEKQAILEAKTTEEKLEKTGLAVARQNKVLKLSRKIQDDTGKELGKMEREMFLREQLKSIEKELGTVGGKSEFDELGAKIEAAGMPDKVKATATKELARLQAMPSFSPEISYVRTYLDWLVGLPWNKKTASEIDIAKAGKILDDDHYGLEKVKERILDYLAVQKLVGRVRGPILCFAGPPGTGKTSIGKSIARSLGRKFVRISLGGVRDEAEIRGFRRTYVGALPGRIIQGIAEAGTKNPVFMLDEIDKLGNDFRGDPSAALLEALDPEQNNEFSDHYLESPFDLSDVLFITTANLLDTVPAPLRDRMEVIEFPGYTEDEKFHIAKGYLIPKAVEANGLAGKKLTFTDNAVRTVIRSWTREAGVRNLERELSTVCRKIARQVAEGKRGHFAVGISDLAKYLGPERFHAAGSEKRDEVGVVTGLAWTEAGGEILRIEAAIMPGSGQLILTGNLGKIMQESAQAAFSYARARSKELGVKVPFHKTSDIHVHVPQGAIPKDGPSAGVAMALALASLVSGRAIRHDVAMTGEVTLRGKVLEIGGVKEKVLAAHRAGMHTVILPKENERDIAEIPKEVRKALRFVYARTMDDVMKTAMMPRAKS